MSDYIYLDLNQLVSCGKYPFNKNQMRDFLTRRDTNGLDLTIRRFGRNLYFRKDLFEEWLDKLMEKDAK